MFYTYGGLYAAPPFMNNSPNASMDYWSRSLFQRLTALIDFEGLPEGTPGQYAWDKDALKYGLFMLGFQVVFRSSTYGIVPQPGALTGYGLQYQPASAIVNTPYFQLKRPLKLGVEAELLKLTPDYTGIFDIITKYAAELKELDTSIKSAVKNCRLAWILAGAGDKGARPMKAIREKVLNGEDVVLDEKLDKDKLDPKNPPWFEFTGDVRANFIVNELLEARRTTLVDFYREIGVRMLDDKKERMLTAEVDAGNAETFIRAEVWIESLKESCEKINAHYGTNITPIINRPDLAENRQSESILQEA